jgi:hypothetical protein
MSEKTTLMLLIFVLVVCLAAVIFINPSDIFPMKNETMNNSSHVNQTTILGIRFSSLGKTQNVQDPIN